MVAILSLFSMKPDISLADEDEILMEDSVSHNTSDPVVTADVKNRDIAVEDSVSYTSILSKGSGLVATDEETHSDIFAQKYSVSQMATDPVAAGNEKSDCKISAVRFFVGGIFSSFTPFFALLGQFT